jgi:hypothetical protein
MQNKRKLNLNENEPIIGGELSSVEWGIESRLPMSLLPRMLAILFVNKAKHRQHCMQFWTLNPGP